jgi:hypothetical protein
MPLPLPASCDIVCSQRWLAFKYRIQCWNCGVQEHQLHCLGCRGSGQGKIDDRISCLNILIIWHWFYILLLTSPIDYFNIASCLSCTLRKILFYVLLFNFWIYLSLVQTVPWFFLPPLSENRSGRCGGITSRTHRVSSSLWTAMIGTVLLKQGMSFTECWMR